MSESASMMLTHTWGSLDRHWVEKCPSILNIAVLLVIMVSDMTKNDSLLQNVLLNKKQSCNPDVNLMN